jgi:hypothetical protein
VGEIVVPTQGVEDWRRLLGDPEKHWRTGYSAKALAYCWEAAKGDFPRSVRNVFEDNAPDVFRSIELLLAKPEHRVPLPGRGYPSQTDLFVLAKCGHDLVSIAVEGKVSESFDLLASDWLKHPTATTEGDADVNDEVAAPPQPSPRPVRLKGLEKPVRVIEVVPEQGLPPLPVVSLQRPWLTKRRMALAAVAGLAVVAAIVAFALTRSGGPGARSSLKANSIGEIDAKTGAIAAQLPLSGAPRALTAGGGYVWGEEYRASLERQWTAAGR